MKSESKCLIITASGIFVKSRKRRVAKKDRLTLSFKFNFAIPKISVGGEVYTEVGIIIYNFYLMLASLKMKFIQDGFSIFLLEDHNFRFLRIHR